MCLCFESTSSHVVKVRSCRSIRFWHDIYCLAAGCLPGLFSIYVQFSFHCSYILKVCVTCLCEEEEREMERRKVKSPYNARRRNKFFSMEFFSPLYLLCFFFSPQDFGYGDKCYHLSGKLFEMDGK